jgi:rhomboid protease GluP
MSEPIAPLYSPSEISENWLTRKPNRHALLIAILSVFIVVLGSFLYWDNVFDLAVLMPANAQTVFSGHQFWRAWTSVFVHGDLSHLLSNLFLFSILGFFLSGYFGLTLFPLGAFFVGGITNLIVLWKMPAAVNLIGLSGVVFWMGGAWLALYFLIETRRSKWQKAIRSIGVGLVLFMPSEAFDPNVSYNAHFVGFALGVISGVLYYFRNRSQIRSAEFFHLVVDSEVSSYQTYSLYHQDTDGLRLV